MRKTTSDQSYEHGAEDISSENRGIETQAIKTMETITPHKPEPKETLFSNTWKILKEPKYFRWLIFSALGFAIFYSFLYGLWKIPVIKFGLVRMTEIGFSDIMFLVLVPLMVGTLISLLKYKADDGSGLATGGTGGTLAGVVSAICPTCQGITIAALGSTIGAVPLEPLIPYLGLLKMVSVLVLSLSLYLTAQGIYTKTCLACEVLSTAATEHHGTEHHAHDKSIFSSIYENNWALTGLIVIVLLLVVNGFLIPRAIAMPAGGGFMVGGGETVTIATGFEYGPKTTLKPMPLATGEQPRVSGYKTKVKTLPTISELEIAPASGDIGQDLVSNIIPHGTPWYGAEAGVSFDDPITAQKLWAKGKAIKLTAEEQQRWERIVNSFTCDYCCGSPQQPTIITRCGCAHAQAAQGMTKWFIKNYGSQYSDEEIYGELARWYALWYPGPTVKRIAQEIQTGI